MTTTPEGCHPGQCSPMRCRGRCNASPWPVPVQLTRARSVITQQERECAAELVMEWAEGNLGRPLTSTRAQLELVGIITAALADARDGSTVPGKRQQVYANLDVTVRAWQGVPHPLDTHHAMLRGKVRRTWAAKLEAEGLRPLGWPPVTTTYLRWSWAGGDPGATTELPDLEGADLVRLSIHGTAVPL